MGEYTRYNGHEVKIGTVEEMYYLRYDQRFKVVPLEGNVNPARDANELLFRFPWPDEDHLQPGADNFHSRGYARSVYVDGFPAPDDVQHDTIQLSGHGYLILLPCPESSAYQDRGAGAYHRRLAAAPDDVGIARNGFAGAVHLCQQRLVDEHLVPILSCGGCGAKWRETDPTRIEELAACLRKGSSNGSFLHTVADRVLAGYYTCTTLGR